MIDFERLRWEQNFLGRTKANSKGPRHKTLGPIQRSLGISPLLVDYCAEIVIEIEQNRNSGE